ncbi:hypothetical protein VTN00DRAFT_3228 [Thermoascus crustaceus]|uniref:uncharacterized protein n=1 Tax=Thermoascus crustaceus TaxID=5088 RepID=UPI0037435717
MTFICPAATCAEQCPQSSFGPDGSCSNTHGYPIHAACWDIIERVIGPRVAEYEDHLALLTKQWVRNLAGYDNLTYAEWAPAHTDPTHVEEVSDIIEKSISRCARKKTKTKTRRWRPCLDPNHSYIEEHLKSPSGLRLPANIEIRYLILDNLDYADAQNAFRAFGWRVLKGCFQRRFPRDLVFEIEQLKTPVPEMDWEFFCLEVERLMESSEVLLNRQRIFRIVRGAEEMFADRVEGRETTDTTKKRKTVSRKGCKSQKRSKK